jgi:hypothetical protein
MIKTNIDSGEKKIQTKIVQVSKVLKDQLKTQIIQKCDQIYLRVEDCCPITLTKVPTAFLKF